MAFSFAKIAASETDEGLVLSPTSVEGWFDLGLRVDGVLSNFFRVTFDDSVGLNSVYFNSTGGPNIRTTSDAAPALPENHVCINS